MEVQGNKGEQKIDFKEVKAIEYVGKILREYFVKWRSHKNAEGMYGVAYWVVKNVYDKTKNDWVRWTAKNVLKKKKLNMKDEYVIASEFYKSGLYKEMEFFKNLDDIINQKSE
jgi:hypothetical protein